MDNLISTIGYLVIGMGLRRLQPFRDDTANVLNLFVIHVSLPALVLLKIPELKLSSELLVPIIMPWFMLVASACMVLACGRLFKWNKPVTGCLLLMVPLGNTSFLGIPMVHAFFGEKGIPYAVLYDQLGSFLALSTYGTVIIAIFGNDSETPSPVYIARKILTFPPFIFLLAAFALKPFPYSPPVTSFLSSLAGTLVPLVMIAVGFQLRLKLHSESLPPFFCGLALKLVIAPLTALLACKVLGLDSLATMVSVFEAGMPPMISAGALAILVGMAPELVAALVGFGILASFITLPLLYRLLA